MGQAHDQAKQLLDEARAEASRDAESILAEARAKAAERQREAERSITQAREQALGELRHAAADLAVGMAERLVQKPLDPNQYRSLVEEVAP